MPNWVDLSGKDKSGKKASVASKQLILQKKSKISTMLKNNINISNQKKEIKSILFSYQLNGAWFEEKTIENKIKTLVDLPGAGYIMKEGAPMLPREGVFVAIPQNAVITKVEYSSPVKEELSGEYEIAPCPKIIREGMEEKFNTDNDIYDSDDIYPKEIVEYSDTAIVEGITCAHIFVNAIRYKPKSKKIIYISEMNIEVSYYTSERKLLPMIERQFYIFSQLRGRGMRYIFLQVSVFKYVLEM